MIRLKRYTIIYLIIAIVIIFLNSRKETFINKQSMGLFSRRLYNNGPLLYRYTCYGRMAGDLSDISPDFYWRHIPVGTFSLALIMEDTTNKKNKITHWIVWNIMSNSELEENDRAKIMGLNDFNFQGYTAPCKEKYEKEFTFTLYALNILTISGLIPKYTRKNDFLKKIKPHILETAKLTVYL
tara:strand:+ start:6493 stop:7041 length:549 start_codon:yes stop_codon:yes gene_type:complete